ncbi:hypothetical protein GCM10023200_03010 [Actinomycetospora chlora]|uniref:Uncharacterized protein n=1 Tax=Actinomycetospora chlora TaxID=663608 RepID=A0ABP9A561_9PSEU
MSMAVVMSEMPDVWRKVLAEHVPDERQYCRACFHDGGRASWPCQTYRIAQEAKWVAEGGLPGTGPHGPGPSRTRLSPPDATQRSAAPTGRPGPAPSSGPIGTGMDRPFAGDPLGEPMTGERPYGSGMTGERSYGSSATGERPYGSTYDAPYGSSFGVDDRPHARW